MKSNVVKKSCEEFCLGLLISNAHENNRRNGYKRDTKNFV